MASPTWWLALVLLPRGQRIATRRAIERGELAARALKDRLVDAYTVAPRHVQEACVEIANCR